MKRDLCPHKVPSGKPCVLCQPVAHPAVVTAPAPEDGPSWVICPLCSSVCTRRYPHSHLKCLVCHAEPAGPVSRRRLRGGL